MRAAGPRLRTRARRRAPWLAAALAGMASAPPPFAAAQDAALIIDRERLDRDAPAADPHVPAFDGVSASEAPREPFAPFILRDVAVQGSSLPAPALDRIVAPYRGAEMDQARLRALVTSLDAAYGESDIALYSIKVPRQDFAGGVVRVEVREGRIASVALNGDTRGDVDLARHYAAALITDAPLRRARMQRSLLLLSDIPGLKTTATAAPSNQTNAIDLGLQLEQRRWSMDFGLNTRGSRSLGRTQIQAVATANALTRLGDQTRLTLASDIGFSHFSYVALSHLQPLGHDGATIQGRVSYLETDPEGGQSGEARAGGVVISYPWLRSSRRNLTLSAGLDALNSESAFLGDAVATERTRTLRAAAAYSAASPRQHSAVRVTLSHGLADWGARSTDPAAALDFYKTNLNAGHVRRFGRQVRLNLRAAAQLADDILPASERFSIGARFGRAFESAIASGDEGQGASAELSWRTREARSAPEIYGFADYGRVSANRAGGADAHLSSAGFGTRLSFAERASLTLEAAHALDKPSATSDDWRAALELSARF